MTLAETLAALHAASFPRGWSVSEFDALLVNPTTHALTTNYGFALLQIIPPEAELVTISILPAARGHGHGRDLLAQALHKAAAHGADTMFLEVDATNAAALALYEHAGFVQTGRRAAYYDHPDAPSTDAIMMTAPVAGAPESSTLR